MKEAKLHITDKEMQLYIKNQLSTYDRERVELEIQLCEACLKSFIYWNSMEQLLHIPQVDDAAEQIITRIESEKSQRKRQERRWIQHPLAQVVVAASITSLLIGTGALSAISASLSGLEEESLRQQIELRNESAGSSSEDHQAETGKENDLEKQMNEEGPQRQHQTSSERLLNKARNWLEKIEDIRFK